MYASRWAFVAILTVGLSACAHKGSPAVDEDGGPSGPPAPRDLPAGDECGNGVDDDGDGQIDEGCPCGAGETQGCFSGAISARAVGACTDGVQRCQVDGSTEWGTWGACEGDAAPVAEVCEGAVDDDCDGAIDNGCPCTTGESRGCGMEFVVAPCSGGVQTCQAGGSWTGCEGAVGPEAEACGADGYGNGVDDDCDGETDELCGCVAEPEMCGDGMDNDCDGEVDERGCVDGGCLEGSTDPECVVDPCAADSSAPGCAGDTCTMRHTGIVELAGSGQTSCARHHDGRVYCWGTNSQGALGVGEEWLELSTSPRLVIDGATALDMGRGTMACVMRGDESWSWGRQAFGGGSPGSYHDVALSPFRVPQTMGLTDIVQMVVGADYQLLLKSDGTVWGWGMDAGGSHALGDGDINSTRSPTAVQALIDDVVDLGTFIRTVCAVRGDGTVWCWGAGQRGIAGPPGGPTHWVTSPVRIVGVDDAVSVAVSGYAACAVLSTGQVSCWGLDGFRGDGSVAGEGAGHTSSAALIPGFTGVHRIVAGQYGSCAIRGDGELWCWGSANLAATPEYSRPERITGIGRVEDVIVGDLPMVSPSSGRFVGEMCVLEECGRVRCWGRNRVGQAGDGTTTERQTPVDVIGLP